MNHKNLMTGIAIFFVLLIGGAGGTYILLTHQPAIATKPLTKVQHPSKSKQSLKKSPALVHAQAIPKDSLGHSAHSTEKATTEARPALVHASTISIKTPTKTNIGSKAFEAQNEKEEKMTLADLQFGLSRTGLEAQTKATLDAYAKQLQDPQWSVLIQGHTDETGSIRKNLHIGLRRADAVKQYLITKGISKDRLHAVSLGEYNPTCMDSTPACQLENRRVSFSVARRDNIKIQHVMPGEQEKAARSEWDKAVQAIELISVPEIHERTIDTPVKVGLIYPGPIHSTRPPSALSDGNKN